MDVDGGGGLLEEDAVVADAQAQEALELPGGRFDGKRRLNSGNQYQ